MKELISNVEVYGLYESVKASKYPKSINTENCFEGITPTVKNLAACDIGTGHDNFLNGIIVQFDLNFSLKAWAQAERYHFLDFVSSQSIMHCVEKFDIRCKCNEYVTENTMLEVERLKQEYEQTRSDENWLRLVYNIPVGFTLTARMTTNYRQLKTIYEQRRHHRLPEWRDFCSWIKTLPYSEFITKGDCEI